MPAPTLNVERCDAKGSGPETAKIAVYIPGCGCLTFCLHHYREHAPVFAALGYQTTVIAAV